METPTLEELCQGFQVVVIPQEIVVHINRNARSLVSKESQFRLMIREGIAGRQAVRSFGPSI